MWGRNGLEQLLQDVRYGLRAMLRSPGLTAVAVIALALGIGANTAIFSVVNAVLLRPLPYQDAERLVVILHQGENPVAPANFLDWQKQNHVFERMGAAEYWGVNLTGDAAGAAAPEHVLALHVTADILPLLGVEPLLGRVFLPEEDAAGRDHEVILSYGLWQRRFAGDTTIIGRTIALSGEKYTVVGVMPRDFKFAPFWATKAELWAPMPLDRKAASRDGNSLRIFARLNPGVSLEQAQAEMSTIAARLEKEFPATNRDVVVRTLKERVVGNIRPALFVLLGAVGFVLLIACANVAHILLARAAVRQKEIAVRTALGAARSRVIRQFLTESLLLAFLGGTAGLVLALVGIRVLIALSPASIPRLDTIGLDGHVLVFVLAVSAFTGVAFGLIPALQASSVNLNDTLKEGGRGSTDGIHRNRLRSLLVVSQFALALVLLVGAGLMIRSFFAIQAIAPGFNPAHVLTMEVSVAGSKEAQPAFRSVFYRRVLEQVRSLPGVQSAGAINHLPLAGDLWGRSFWVEGRPAPLPGDGPVAVYRMVMPGYFRTMNISLRSGREINEGDTLNVPGVVIINEALARKYWPGEDPIAKRISLDDPAKKPSWLTVVGIASNAKQSEWTANANPEVYLALQQNRAYLEEIHSSVSYLTLVVRTSGDPAGIAPAVQNEIHSIAKDVTLSHVQTMDEVVAESTAQPRFYVVTLGAFAAVALILAAVGIYGVMSYSVSRRTHELGIRMTLGAERSDVLRLVVGQGMILALVGAGVGLVLALALTRLMASLLYGVQPHDPATFFGVALVLICVALAANYIPARRATRIDPMVALRYE